MGAAGAARQRSEIRGDHIDRLGCHHQRGRKPADHALQPGCRSDLRVPRSGGHRAEARDPAAGALSGGTCAAPAELRGVAGGFAADGRAPGDPRTTQERHGVPRRSVDLEARPVRRPGVQCAAARHHRPEADRACPALSRPGRDNSGLLARLRNHAQQRGCVDRAGARRLVRDLHPGRRRHGAGERRCRS
jgi:hypothetical protein